MFMLNVDVGVVRGITFIRLEGVLTNRTFKDFDLELDYLLYNLGMHFYVINFLDVLDIENSVFNKMQNKLYEIFLNCGNVVMCGIKSTFKDKRLAYVNSEVDAFKYFNI